ISLGDVSEVKDDSVTLKQRFMVNGRPAVGLALHFRSEEDAVAVGKRVEQRLAQIAGTAPKATTFEVVHNQPEWIGQRVNTFVGSLGEGILLVIAIITLGMGLRASLVVASVLPLSMGGAIVGLYMAGMSLENMSIAGLIMALGLLVDDAV